MDEDISLDSNKLKLNASKAGYRDGVEEGRNVNFQHSFDEGYKSGFRNGFALGQLKASFKNVPEVLSATKRGNCCICKDESLFLKSNTEKVSVQWENTEELLKMKV